MSRLVKLLTVSAVAGAAVLATAGPVAAQVWVRPAYPGLQPWIYRTQYSGMYFPSPTGGYGFYNQHQYYSTSPLRTFILGPGYGVPGNYFYGSAAGMTGAGLNLAGREQAALQQAQRDARNNAAARQQIFDQWAYERGSKRVDASKPKDLPEGLRQAVLNPSPDDLASGKALNDLLAAIQGWEAKGVKAETPFLPPDALAKVVVTGGPPADALNLLRTGKVNFPPALQAPDLDAIRAAIERDAAAAAEQARAGKKVDPVLADRIADAARRLKTKAAPLLRGETGFDDATAAVGSLNRLEAAARFLKSPDANGLFVPAWQAVGATLSDLSKYMGRFKLRFGPAAPGDEGVYAAVHRGMVGYLTQLTQNQR